MHGKGKMRFTRTPKHVAKIPRKPGKTLQQIRDGKK